MGSKIPILFELMSERKIKAKQLSDAIGASEGNISDWKSGKSTPSAEKLVLIADYLNVSVDYLLGRKDIDPQAEEFLRVFSKISKEKRTLALNILNQFVNID